MMFLKNYCMEFMILLAMECITLNIIIIYKNVSRNFQFLFCFLDITYFVEIYECIS